MTRARILPESRARDLTPGDFATGQRVIAQIDLLEAEVIAPLGAVPENQRRQSWLLTTGARSAVMMYDAGGTIAFSPEWELVTAPVPTEANKQKARWHVVPHTHGEVSRDSVRIAPHLPTAWVSCAEGCCNARFVH